MWTYWNLIIRRYPMVTWSEFRNWYPWQIGAAMGLDRTGPSDADLDVIARFEAEAVKGPSSDRRG